MNHVELHRRILDRERQLLEKRAKYEAQVDVALAALRSARREQAAARSSRPPARWLPAMRPLRWARFRLAQAWGRA